MSTSPKLISNYRQYELYEFLCAYAPHNKVYCLTEFINISQNNLNQNYYVVRLTSDAKKAWQACSYSLNLFLADTKSKILINGASKIFEFIPKVGSQREFKIYEHMLSDHITLGEIRAAACQIFDDFIVKKKKMLKQFDPLARINPLTVHDHQNIIFDIYKFFLQTPEEYLQQIKNGIVNRLVHRMTSTNIIFKFMDIKFMLNCLIAYKNERSKQIAPIYNQTVFAYSQTQQHLVPQQFSQGPFKSEKRVPSLEPSKFSPKKKQKTYQDPGSLDYYRKQCIELQKKFRLVKSENNQLIQRNSQLVLKNSQLVFKNQELRAKNARIRLQNDGDDDQKTLYQQYWTQQLIKLKQQREKQQTRLQVDRKLHNDISE